MKIVDCFMYSDEDMLLDVRLNILDKYVSNFIICEASFNHNGSSKNLNFNINNFLKFKDKITYLTIDKQPNNLCKILENDVDDKKNSKILDNALNRENYQRNFISKGLDKFSDEDLIIINDLDEIPNLENFKYKNKITFFKQKMFYYKFNLTYPNFIWMGSKACKKKHLIKPQWLRNIKSKKYPFWRLDTFFSEKKYNDVNFIENGGWHFSNVKNAKELDKKMKTFLHHLEYEKSGMDSKDIEKNISDKNVFYNHFADKKSNKLEYQKKLVKINLNELPDFILFNKKKLDQWID
jgi:beta-1,4-mannosyl-glycoprotein beta-1,4-N-acetylglucosaminyltransferase